MRLGPSAPPPANEPCLPGLVRARPRVGGGPRARESRSMDKGVARLGAENRFPSGGAAGDARARTRACPAAGFLPRSSPEGGPSRVISRAGGEEIWSESSRGRGTAEDNARGRRGGAGVSRGGGGERRREIEVGV